jgi:hypothetical protein
VRAAALSLALLPAACGEGGAAGDAGFDAGLDLWPPLSAAARPDVVADGLRAPCGLAEAGGDLYVAEEGADRVLLLPGSAAPFEIVADGLAGPRWLALDGDAVFAAQPMSGRVTRIATTTSDVATAQASPGRVRVAGGFVYWIAAGSGAADGAVRRAPVAGGAVEDVATGLGSPRGLAVTSARAYFTESATRTVGYAPIEGGAVTSLDDPDGTPAEVVADEAAGELFWSSPGQRGGGWIRLADLDLGGGAYTSFSPPGPGPLALAEDSVLWGTGSTVTQAPRAGGDYQDLAVQVSVCDLLLTGGGIYFTDALAGRVLHLPPP